MKKSLSQQRREAILKELGIITEAEFAEWQKSGRYPTIARLRHSTPFVISPLLARDKRLSALAIRLYLILSDLAVHSTVREYAEDIARLLKCSTRHMGRMQKELDGTDWIDVKVVGFGFPNVVIVNEKSTSTP